MSRRIELNLRGGGRPPSTDNPAYPVVLSRLRDPSRGDPSYLNHVRITTAAEIKGEGGRTEGVGRAIYARPTRILETFKFLYANK